MAINRQEVDRLFENLNSDDFSIKFEAAYHLKGLLYSKNTYIIMEAITNRTEITASLAVWTINYGHLAEADCILDVLFILSYDEQNVEAIVRKSEALTRLISLLQLGSIDKKIRILMLLKNISDSNKEPDLINSIESFFDVLVTQLQNDDSSVRHEATNVLFNFAQLHSEEIIFARGISALVNRLQDQSIQVREKALCVLRELARNSVSSHIIIDGSGLTIPSLLTLLQDSSPIIRGAAAEIIAILVNMDKYHKKSFEQTKGLLILIDLVVDEEAEVRKKALCSLASILELDIFSMPRPTTNFIKKILISLYDSDKSVVQSSLELLEICSESPNFLADFGALDGIPMLVNMLGRFGGDYNIKSTALDVLLLFVNYQRRIYDLCSRSAIGWWVKLLDDNVEIRNKSLLILEKILHYLINPGGSRVFEIINDFNGVEKLLRIYVNEQGDNLSTRVVNLFSLALKTGDWSYINNSPSLSEDNKVALCISILLVQLKRSNGIALHLPLTILYSFSSNMDYRQEMKKQEIIIEIKKKTAQALEPMRSVLSMFWNLVLTLNDKDRNVLNIVNIDRLLSKSFISVDLVADHLMQSKIEAAKKEALRVDSIFKKYAKARALTVYEVLTVLGKKAWRPSSLSNENGELVKSAHSHTLFQEVMRCHDLVNSIALMATTPTALEVDLKTIIIDKNTKITSFRQKFVQWLDEMGLYTTALENWARENERVPDFHLGFFNRKIQQMMRFSEEQVNDLFSKLSDVELFVTEAITISRDRNWYNEPKMVIPILNRLVVFTNNGIILSKFLREINYVNTDEIEKIKVQLFFCDKPKITERLISAIASYFLVLETASPSMAVRARMIHHIFNHKNSNYLMKVLENMVLTLERVDFIAGEVQLKQDFDRFMEEKERLLSEFSTTFLTESMLLESSIYAALFDDMSIDYEKMFTSTF